MISYQVPQFHARLAPNEQATFVPDRNELLVRVHAAGVCHTDIHNWQGAYDMGLRAMEALAVIAVRVGQLMVAAQGRIAYIGLNPVMLGLAGERAKGVDARVERAPQGEHA